MQQAETIFNVIRERGRRGLPLKDVYRLLYNPELYLLAYGRLYRNAGAMTRGTTPETVDAMSLAKIDAITADLRFERYRWKPVRRVAIPKSNGKTRPLVVLLTKLDLNSRCVFCKPLPHLVVRPRPLHGAGITMIVFWP